MKLTENEINGDPGRYWPHWNKQNFGKTVFEGIFSDFSLFYILTAKIENFARALKKNSFLGHFPNYSHHAFGQLASIPYNNQMFFSAFKTE